MHIVVVRYLYSVNRVLILQPTLCLLMWNHCLPEFHFNWHCSVPRQLYNNLLLNYRYLQKISWTYWNFALHVITFSTTLNTKNSCMAQWWGRLFLLLSQKLWCNKWTNAPLQLADKRYYFAYATLATPLLPFKTTKLTNFTTTYTNGAATSSLL